MDLNYNKLIVKQELDFIEAIAGIEVKNKYKILAEDKKEILYAYEQSNTLARILLKQLRPLTITIIDTNNNNTILKINKKFAFLLPIFEILDSNNNLIAKVKSKFSLNSKLEVFDINNQQIFYTKNQVMHPWTFNIYKNKNENNSLALILKKFSGVGKEMFTKADNFSIDFNQIQDNQEKEIIIALSLIIDLFIFENR